MTNQNTFGQKYKRIQKITAFEILCSKLCIEENKFFGSYCQTLNHYIFRTKS